MSSKVPVRGRTETRGHGSELRVQPGDAGYAGLQDHPGHTPAAGLDFPSLFVHQTSGVTGNTTSQAVEQEQEVGRDPVSFWERGPVAPVVGVGRVPWKVKVLLCVMGGRVVQNHICESIILPLN